MAGTPSLSKNVAYNVGGYAMSVAVVFLLTPVTLSSLGDARFGAWSLVNELIGYYGLLDLGLRGAITFFVARNLAKGQALDVKQTVASGFWALAACGFVAFLIAACLCLAFPYLFRSEGLDVPEAQLALLIMSALIGLSLPMSALTGALVGKQRFDITLRLEIVNRLLTAAATYLVLKAGGGLVELALTQAAGRVYYWISTFAACRKTFGTTFVRPSWFKADRVRDLTRYGSRNAIAGVALLVIYRVDIAVVAMFAGMAQVTYYSIGSMLVSYASSLCSSMTQAFTPRFAHLDASEATDKLRRLYLSAMRMIGLVVTALGAGMMVFGTDFIRLWLGPEYVRGAWTERSDVIMAILLAANLPRMLQSISWQLMYGIGKVRFLMWLNICEAILNLGLSLLLVHYYGPAGVAIGTLVPLLLSHLVAMPMYTSRVLGMPSWRLLRQGLAVPIVTGVAIALIAISLKHLVPPVSWATFSLDVLLTVALGGLLCFFAGLEPDERLKLSAMLAKSPPA